MDDFFAKHKSSVILTYSWGEQQSDFSVEDLYQAFKARMLSEMAQENDEQGDGKPDNT